MSSLLRRFQFRPFLSASALLAFITLVTLGVWQLHRLEWKQALVTKIEARVAAEPIPFEESMARYDAGEDMAYTPVYVNGAYLHAQEAHVFGTWEAKPGYYIFTPFQGDAGTVYVNRGFAPLAFKDEAQRPGGQHTSSHRVIGLFRTEERPRGVAAWVTPKNLPAQNQWHVRAPALFAAHAGLEAPSAYIDSNGAENPFEWPKGGTTRVEFNNRHMEYALTWFGLAATLVGVWFFFSLRTK